MQRFLVNIVLFFGCFNQFSHGTIQLWVNVDGSPGGTLYYRAAGFPDDCIDKTIQQTIDDLRVILNSGSPNCIKFQERNGHESFPFYVDFRYSGSCKVNIPNPGINSNKQTIVIPINSQCFHRRDLVYNLARLLGLPDEHTRPDRDEFLTIHWDNIEKNLYRSNLYNKSIPEVWDKIGHMPYDYTSVTHVRPFDHAVDSSKPTVSAKYPGVYFGDHMNLSVIDVQKIRTLYDCQQDEDSQDFTVYRPVHCTFDLPLCGLVNDWTSPGAKWTERKGPVSERGPQTDHSNGAGKYMYLNGDTPRTASLVSVREISPGPVCMSLYYYKEHNTTTLIIYQKESTSGQTTTIKEIVGSQETSWTEVMFNTTTTTPWRILIEASTEEGEVAIDDVTVQYGDCPVYNQCGGQ